MLAFAQGAQGFGSVLLALALTFSGAQNNDGIGLGVTLASRTLPTILIVLFGGVIADRWNRSKVAALFLGLVAVSNALLSFAVPESGLSSWRVQGIAFVGGVFGALGAPSLYALLPSLVDNSEVVTANGVVRGFRNISGVVGPAIGALIFGRFGAEAIFWTATCFSAIPSFLVALIHVDAPAENQASMLTDLKSARALVTQNDWLLFGIAFWALFLAMQSGAADVVQPLWVITHGSEATWSAMTTAMALGYLLGSVVATRLKILRRMVTWSVITGSVASVQLLSVVLTPQPVVWAVASFIAGFGLELSGVLWASALQTRVPRDELGKVSSLDYAVSFGFIPFAYAIFGALSAPKSNFSILLGSGLILLLGGGAAALMGNRIEARDSFGPYLPEESSDTSAA